MVLQTAWQHHWGYAWRDGICNVTIVDKNGMRFSTTISLAAVLVGLFLVSSFTSAQTTTPGTKCENKPFKTAEEREKVKKEDHECYLLRIKYEQGVTDGQSLQDINSAIQSIQTGLQFLQQLQSLGGSSDGGSQSAPTNSTPNPYLPVNSQPTNNSLYQDGSAPSLYFQPDANTGATTTTITFGQGSTARSYRITGESYTNITTGEVLTWPEIQTREGLRPMPSGSDSDQASDQSNHPVFTRIDSTRIDTPTKSVLTQIFARPTSESQRSHPLSPNLFTNFSNQVTRASQLITPPADLQANANVSQEMDFGFILFTGGIFSPLQNFIVGLTNGLTALLSRL
jgi:hypothetical protein